MNPFAACGMAMARGLGLGTGWGLGIAIAMMILQLVAPNLPAPSMSQLQRLVEQYLKGAPADPPAPPSAVAPPAPQDTPKPTGPTLQDVYDACMGRTS
ncbi:MAG: hypothetical protein ACJ8H8_33670 [Geminicoccaceae bacterium]